MHWEQLTFVRSVKSIYPDFFKDVSVLEIGSYNVNGSIRQEFIAKKYVGVDLIPGPDVDLVCSGQDFSSSERFDVCISTECFEHNPLYKETFINMVCHTRAGGMVMFTCAGPGRPEHGTMRSDPWSSPGTMQTNYYRNLTPDDFSDVDFDVLFSEWRFLHNSSSHDLYFIGLTRDCARLNHLAQLTVNVEQISSKAEAAFDLVRSGQVDEGARRMQEACDEAPAFVRAHVLARQGWLLSLAGRGEEALASVREALTLSDAADLHWQLGTILHICDRAQDAFEPARRAVARAPSNARFAYFLGALHQGRDELLESEALLERAISLEPTLAAAHQQLSLVRIKQGRWSEAADAAERAAALEPDMPGIAAHLSAVRVRAAAV